MMRTPHLLSLLSILLLAAACTNASVSSKSFDAGPAPSTPTAQPAVVEDKPCVIMAYTSDYETTHETTPDRWLRDVNENMEIVLGKDLQLIGPSYDVGSGARIFFKNGERVSFPETASSFDNIEDKLVSDGSTFCTLSISYSDRDFNKMLDRKRDRASGSIYPKLNLPAGKISARGYGVMESRQSTPLAEMGEKKCDPKNETTISSYAFRFDGPVFLKYPNGRASESLLTGMTCRGHNIRFSSLKNVLGESIVKSIK